MSELQPKGNPLHGAALIAGMFCLVCGISGGEGFLIAGALLFSGGLIAAAIENRSA